jgi:ABC-type phosphate transport system substrate-binding protein
MTNQTRQLGPRRRTAAAFLASLLLPAGRVLAAPGPAFRLVVHPRNPLQAINRSVAALAFLKKTQVWQHGGPIRPVDLGVDSDVRRRFSEEVLGRSQVAVKNYWQQMIFSGRGLPPPELSSDDEVVQFVLRNPGAIGYVSGDAVLKGTKPLDLK